MWIDFSCNFDQTCRFEKTIQLCFPEIIFSHCVTSDKTRDRWPSRLLGEEFGPQHPPPAGECDLLSAITIDIKHGPLFSKKPWSFGSICVTFYLFVIFVISHYFEAVERIVGGENFPSEAADVFLNARLHVFVSYVFVKYFCPSQRSQRARHKGANAHCLSFKNLIYVVFPLRRELHEKNVLTRFRRRTCLLSFSKTYLNSVLTAIRN